MIVAALASAFRDQTQVGHHRSAVIRLGGVVQAVKRLHPTVPVVVIDDHSPDGTADAADRAGALVTDRVHGKELYMPMNSSASPVNRLTGSYTDKDTHTPAYKETSVQMRVLAETGASPLPLTNHRFGHPTPQRGVEVERKWKRADYRPPGSQLAPTQPA